MFTVYPSCHVSPDRQHGTFVVSKLQNLGLGKPDTGALVKVLAQGHLCTWGKVTVLESGRKHLFGAVLVPALAPILTEDKERLKNEADHSRRVGSRFNKARELAYQPGLSQAPQAW